MIAIIDYGVGNLFSLASSLKSLGLETKVTRDAAAIRAADHIILPGVGAFADAMAKLEATGLVPVIKQEVEHKPLLGICLGMQLLFEQSFEGGTYKGLGFLPGDIVPFHTKLKVPHMGWNALEFRQDHWLKKNLPKEPYVYFVHSYHKAPAATPDVIATADYGEPVPAICGLNNVLGFQFHPEKSGRVGQQLLKNVVDYVKQEG